MDGMMAGDGGAASAPELAKRQREQPERPRGRRGCAPGRQMTSLKRGAAFAASGVNGRVAPALRRVSFAFASGCG